MIFENVKGTTSMQFGNAALLLSPSGNGEHYGYEQNIPPPGFGNRRNLN